MSDAFLEYNDISMEEMGFLQYERVKEYAKNNWNLTVPQIEHCLKGWNYGRCNFEGKSMEFDVDGKPCFEVQLNNVINCSAVGKNESVLEFHQNDDCPISLVEMRLYIPQDPDGPEDADPIEEFRQSVMKYAGVETETDQPVAILSQILCKTPRGRYDIKIFPNHLSLHGKTYDYKIPIKTIMRLFLLPHKDGRHMYFVISVNPPIRQGQTRYHFLVLEFAKEEEIELELGLTEWVVDKGGPCKVFPVELAENKQYRGLKKEMSGQLYEVVSKLFRVLVDQKITVPGSFVGSSGTPAIGCAYKQAAGSLYPLEKGFVYVWQPPMYIRFEEISTVNFARSDVATRSFDFEVDLKIGTTHVFNSVEKEEYTRLYDFLNNKRLRIRNAKRLDKPSYKEDNFAGSDDDEIDPYKETLKQEAKDKEDDELSESDEEDSDYNVEQDSKKEKHKKEEESSDSGSDDSNEESDDSENSGGSNDDETPKKKSPKPIKEKSKLSSKAMVPKKRAKKPDKDLEAPKRAMSSYMLWLGENRSSIQKQGDGVTDTAKRAGLMWNNMSAQDKEPYEKKARQGKERYKQQMDDYKSGKSVSSNKKISNKAADTPTKATKSKEFISDSDSSSDDDGTPLKKPKEDLQQNEKIAEEGLDYSSSD